MSSSRAKVVEFPKVTSSLSPDSLKAWPISQVVDTLYNHQLRVEAFKPTKKNHEILEAELLRRFEGEPADAMCTADGELAQATLTAKPEKRVITSPGKLFRMMKKYSESAFESICSFLLSDVDRYIPEERHPEFLEKKRQGKRSVTVFAKPEPVNPVVEMPAPASLPKAA